MKYRMKLKIKYLLYNILGFLVLGIICLIAYLNDKLIETCVTIILFYIYRNLFEKQYHANSLFLCGIISIIVFTIIIKLEVSIKISILYSSILTLIITIISYFVRDYLDNKLLVKHYREKLEKMNTKCIENLTEEEMIKLMPSVRYEVIHIVYGYFHKSKEISSAIYAYKNNISERTLFRYIKSLKEKYQSLGENA